MVIAIHHFDERHGRLGGGTAIRAPESEALHGFVGSGTDDSSISKKNIYRSQVAHGPANRQVPSVGPVRRPHTKLFRESPSRPCLPHRRDAPHGIPAHGIGEPRRATRHGAAAGPEIFPSRHPETGANSHENSSHHQPQTAH